MKNSFQIGNVHIPSLAVLAPMAGVTDHAFRVLCKSHGAGLVYTEFVSSNGIIRENQKTLDMMAFTPDERPIVVQIFGETIDAMKRSAEYIQNVVKPDIIDLNFGCPVPKVTKKGAGSAILKDMPLMEEMTKAIVSAVNIPVTAKIRAGWDSKCIVAPETAAMLESHGISAVAIHPRTTKQLYKGNADWELIAKAKEAVNHIPIIGNGDITSAQSAKEMMDLTHCDAVMIGRRALGNPWIFSEINACFTCKELPAPPSLIDRVDMCRHHLLLEREDKGEIQAANLIKRHLSWYLKGFHGVSKYRSKIFMTKDIGIMLEILDEVREYILTDPILREKAYYENGALLDEVSY